MTKLHQLLPVEAGLRTTARNDLIKLHRIAQSAERFSGLSRTYQPRADDGDRFPPESKLVELRASEVLQAARDLLVRFFDIVATKDNTNCEAKADIVIDGQVLVKDVPVTTLIFLEKQLNNDLHTFASKLPTLDPGEVWTFDELQQYYTTDPTQTVKTRKQPRPITKWEPPDPSYTQQAQVEMWQEDVQIGDWTTRKLSGALPAKVVAEMVDRIRKLTDAVKVARETANMATVRELKVGSAVLDYIFGPASS